MLEYIKGNLFDASTDALAHGCNVQGKMHQGIAVEFRERYPEMFVDYKQRCEREEFQLGQGYIFCREEKLYIINLATQGEEGARVQHIDTALAWLARSYMNFRIQSVAMPRIGCGLGKLEWEVVHPLFEKYFENSKLRVEIWTL